MKKDVTGRSNLSCFQTVIIENKILQSFYNLYYLNAIILITINYNKNYYRLVKIYRFIQHRLTEKIYQAFDNSIMIYIELIGTLQKLLYFIFINHSLKTG